jgi:hypothetical protein
VVHGDELEVERPNVEALPAVDALHLWTNLVLVKFRFNERECQRRTVERDVASEFEEIGNSTDVVFVPVRENDADDVVEAIADGSEVGKDEVDAGLGFLREQNTAVDDEQTTVEFEHGHVAADFAESAERDDSESSRVERARFTD